MDLSSDTTPGRLLSYRREYQHNDDSVMLYTGIPTTAVTMVAAAPPSPNRFKAMG
jgi:hypothetical protein